jgi:hypothetical protein
MNDVSSIQHARTERLIGALLTIAGAALSYYFVYLPYIAMTQGEASVAFGFKSAVIGPLCIGIGIVQIVGGARAPVWFAREGPVTWRTVVLALSLVAVSTLAFFWLKAQAATLGYS